MKAVIVTLASVFAAQTWAGSGELRWQACSDPKLAKAKCGTLTVWENRVAKTGRTIDLNLVVLPATGKNPQPDPVFVLLGGPGVMEIGRGFLETADQRSLDVSCSNVKHRPFLLP